MTGLLWESKTNDGGLHDGNYDYTNYTSGYNPVGDFGTASDATGFINAVNSQGLCGATDWRLPTILELQSLVDSSKGVTEPTIDNRFFANMQETAYWSSSPVAGHSNYAWYVDFDDGTVTYDPRGSSYNVRLVSAPPLVEPRFTVSADGQEVTDTRTDLIWKRCAEGMSWKGGACTGEYVTPEWPDALKRAANAAKATGLGWRLPNRNELASLVDYTAVPFAGPVINGTAFPQTPFDGFWSSSPYAGDPIDDEEEDSKDPQVTWYIDFVDGGTYNAYQDSNFAVRLVRDGK